MIISFSTVFRKLILKNAFFIIFLLCTTIAFSDNDDVNNLNGDDDKQMIEEADKLCMAGEFEKGIQIYQDIIDSGVKNFKIYYNYGYALYKAGQIGKSRFMLERAFFYRPMNEDLFVNLKILYSGISDFPEEMLEDFMFLKVIFAIQPFIVYIILTILFFFILIFGLIGIRKKNSFFIRISVISSFFSFLFICLFLLQIFYYNRQHTIVLNDTVSYISPDSDVVIKDLREGDKITIVDQLGLYFRVRFDDNSVGWIKKNDIITNKSF